MIHLEKLCKKKSRFDLATQITMPIFQKIATPGMLVKPTVSKPIDMISMLSQITVKVPLSQLFKI